jgi:hypothetical protein
MWAVGGMKKKTGFRDGVFWGVEMTKKVKQITFSSVLMEIQEKERKYNFFNILP